jgi:hypothetical protein
LKKDNDNAHSFNLRHDDVTLRGARLKRDVLDTFQLVVACRHLYGVRQLRRLTDHSILRS